MSNDDEYECKYFHVLLLLLQSEFQNEAKSLPSGTSLFVLAMKYMNILVDFREKYLWKLCMKMNRNGIIKLVLLFQVGLPCVGLELMASSHNT